MRETRNQIFARTLLALSLGLLCQVPCKQVELESKELRANSNCLSETERKTESKTESKAVQFHKTRNLEFVQIVSAHFWATTQKVLRKWPKVAGEEKEKTVCGEKEEEKGKLAERNEAKRAKEDR